MATNKASDINQIPASYWVDIRYEENDETFKEQIRADLFLQTPWPIPPHDLCEMCLYWSESDDGSSLIDGVNVTFDTVKPYIAYDKRDEEAVKYQEAFDVFDLHRLDIDGEL